MRRSLNWLNPSTTAMMRPAGVGLSQDARILMIRDLFHIDRAHVNFRLAAGALVAFLIAEGLESILGIGLAQAGLAASLVLAAGRTGDLRTRLVQMGVITAIGGAFGFLSYLSADTAWQAALVLGVVAYTTGLAYAYGPAAGKAGFYLLIWALVVLIGTAEGVDPSASGGECGGAVGIGCGRFTVCRRGKVFF